VAGAFVKELAVGQAFSNKAAGTTLAVTFTASSAAGNLIAAFFIFDNAATASKPVVSSISVPAGETASWVFLGAARSTSTSAGAFASGEMWCIKTTVAWTLPTITVTLDTSTVMKSAGYIEYSGADAVARSTGGTAYSTTTTAASATTTGTTPQVDDLVLGLTFQSNVASGTFVDADTTGGAWVLRTPMGSTGGSAASNNGGCAQDKILTAATHQTLNAGGTVTAGNGAIVAILQASVQVTITQAAYQFFDDAGTESGAASLAALNTSVVGNLANGDGFGVLRVRLQSTNAVAVPATDDWQLQWEKNGNGTWTNITTGGTTVQGYDNPNLTGGAVTTNRMGAGTGSFVAGKISETGDVPNLGWTANNYTELVFSLKLLAANFIAGDTLRFRVLRNGATTGLTYTQTPTINIVKATSSLVDTFVTTVDKATNWPNSSVQVVWDSPTQSAKIPCTTSYYSMNTVQGATASYDFIGSSLVAQVTPPAVGTGTREIFMEISGVTTAQQKLNFYVSGTTFAARYMIGGTPTVVRSVTWNPATYGNWWRIRESAGTIYWDTSLDGITWTNFTSVATSTITWSLNQVSIGFSCGYFGTETADNGFIDNVNVAPYVLAPLDTANASSADTTTVTPVVTSTDLGTPLDTANASTTDIPTLVQIYVLAPLETFNASSADVTTLTQVHVLGAPLDTANANSADIPTLAATYALAPLDTANASSADIPTLTVFVTYTLAPVDTANNSSTDIPALSQVHVLVQVDTFNANSADIPPLTQVQVLAPLDTANASSADIPVLTQVNKLTALDTFDASSTDIPTLAQVHVLAPVDTFDASSADVTTLTQVHKLTPVDTFDASSADIPALTGVHLLGVPLDTFNASSTDIPVLTQVHKLSPLDTFNSHSTTTTVVVPPGSFIPVHTFNSSTADIPALTQVHLLAPLDTANASSADIPVLVRTVILAPLDTANSSSTDIPTLVRIVTLAPLDTFNANSADTSTVVPPGSLAPLDTFNTTSSDTTSLSQAHVLAPAHTFHEHSLGRPSLLVFVWLYPPDSVNAHTSTEPLLTQVHLLAPRDTLVTHQTDGAVLFVGVSHEPLAVLYPDSVLYMGTGRIIAIYEGATQVWPPNGARLAREPARMEG
jgi:hypothetical protein